MIIFITKTDFIKRYTLTDVICRIPVWIAGHVDRFKKLQAAWNITKVSNLGKLDYFQVTFISIMNGAVLDKWGKGSRNGGSDIQKV